jgi:hypothetical protein
MVEIVMLAIFMGSAAHLRQDLAAALIGKKYPQTNLGGGSTKGGLGHPLCLMMIN